MIASKINNSQFIPCIHTHAHSANGLGRQNIPILPITYQSKWNQICYYFFLDRTKGFHAIHHLVHEYFLTTFHLLLQYDVYNLCVLNHFSLHSQYYKLYIDWQIFFWPYNNNHTIRKVCIQKKQSFKMVLEWNVHWYL